MLVVGLTGGIATGKSTASAYLQSHLGIRVIDTDAIARQVVQPGQPAHREIVSTFGSSILQDPQNPGTSEIDRTALGRIIFDDPRLRKRLNDITHKRIAWIVFKQVCAAYFRFERIVVLDVPLLFEAGWDKFISTTVLVTW